MKYFLEVESKTWQMKENFNLFDHEETLLKEKKFKIDRSGIVVRNSNDFNILFISENEISKSIMIDTEILFQIKKMQGLYKIINPNQSKQLLYKIVPNLQNNGIEKFLLFQNDVIKIGKKEIKVIKLENQKQTNNTHYKQNASSFFSQLDQKFFQTIIRSSQYNQSQLQTLPCCRICLSHTYKANNLITNCCNCLGSAKYTHKQCLSKWIIPRIKLNIIKDQIAYSISKQGATCQLCRKYFNFDLIISIIFNQQVKIYCLLQIKDLEDEIVILNFTEKSDIIIGRGTNSDLNLNDITVSRAHCKIIYNIQRGIFLIRDLNSKFGTSLQFRDEKINNIIQIQKGRTIIKLTKKPQYNILFKFMKFCGLVDEIAQQEESIIFFQVS